MSLFSNLINHVFSVIYPAEQAAVAKIEEVKADVVQGAQTAIEEAHEVIASVEAHVQEKITAAVDAADNLAAAILDSAPAKRILIDVLNARAKRRLAETGEDLTDWPNSIVDLLKLSDQDSSLSYRKELAAEFGYEGKFTGTAEQNQWLSAEVMKRLSV